MANAKPHMKDTAVNSSQQMPASDSGAFPRSPRFLNADEAAHILRMDSHTLVRWARYGYVPAHPLGEGKRKLWRFIEAELTQWLQQREAPSRKPAASIMGTAIGAHVRRIA
jgi:predicted DNA-binding transcriptional regulator AlpA